MIGYAAGKMRRFRIRIVRRSERRAAERRHPLRRRFDEDRIARDQPAAGSPSSALQPSHRVAMCQRPPAVEG
jgi:hypothetical protein